MIINIIIINNNNSNKKTRNNNNKNNNVQRCWMKCYVLVVFNVYSYLT